MSDNFAHPPKFDTIVNRAQAVAGSGAPENSIELDTDLYAGDGGRLSGCLTSGWSEVEQWGRWTNGGKASLHVFIRCPFYSDIIATFVVQGYVSHKTPEQSITIIINGAKSARWVLVSGDPVEKILYIPATAPNFGRTAAIVDLIFLIDSPESPLALGLSDDPRLLGLGLRSVRFSLASSFSDEAIEYIKHKVEPDVDLEGGNGGVLTRDGGWSYAEEWGRWTEAPTASFRVFIECTSPCEIIAEFLVQGYLSHITNEQNVAVMVNGRKIDDWNFLSKDPIVKSLRVPADAVSLKRKRVELDFNFVIASPERPSGTGLGKDRRLLGLGLRRVRFSLAKPAAASSSDAPNLHRERRGKARKDRHQNGSNVASLQRSAKTAIRKRN